MPSAGPATRRPNAPDARRAAVEIIGAVLAGSSRAQERIERYPRLGEMKDADRRLLTELVYGVLRHLRTLDAVIAAFSKTALDKMDGAVHQVLRVALYQVLFLDRVPDRAAVNCAVNLVRRLGRRAPLPGFVNGLLRAVTRSVKFVEQPAEDGSRNAVFCREARWALFGRKVLPAPADAAAYLADAFSHPEWLVARWLDRFGREQTEEILKADNEPPPLFVRPNALRLDTDELMNRLRGEGIAAERAANGMALRLPGGTRVAELAAFQEGCFYVQDVSAMQVAPFTQVRPREKVIDFCAAPGGKTTHLAELMRNEGEVAAVDMSSGRIARIEENAQRLGLNIIRCVENDARDFAGQHADEFDRGLVDAPCTNTGVLRRRVEARWRISPASVSRMAEVQRELLRAAAGVVRAGGVLVYSTCSLELEENREVVDALLAERNDYEREEERLLLPESGGGDGGYMARLKRKTSNIERPTSNVEV